MNSNGLNINLIIMKTKIGFSRNAAFIPLVVALSSANIANAVLIGSYVNGTDVDADAFTNLAPAVTGATVTDLVNFGLEAGGNITRTSFNVDTPAGPTAGSSMASEWLFGRIGNPGGTGFVAADSGNFYTGFTITADTGNALDLTDLVFDYYGTSNDSNLLFMGQAEAFLSVDGGAFTSFGSVVSNDTDAVIGNNGPVVTADFDLSSITGAETVEVRIAFGTDGSTAGANPFAATGFVQGIQLNGEIVPIPEPSSIALIGMFGASLVVRRRRK